MYKSISVYILFLLSAGLDASSIMTDLVHMGDSVFPLYSYPLEPYFKKFGNRAKRPDGYRSTGNWRGYTGTWRIQNDSLLLCKIHYRTTFHDDPIECIVETFGDTVPQLAEWYTGRLVLREGIDLSTERVLELTMKGKRSIFIKNGLRVPEESMRKQEKGTRKVPLYNRYRERLLILLGIPQ